MRGALFPALLAGVAILCLGGCDDNDTETKNADKVYASLDDCKADLPADECEKGFAQSSQAHEQSAPHFGAASSCEDVYGPGNCVPRGSGSDSYFMPMMLGYMMGGGGGGYHYSPVYVDRYGRSYSGTTVINRTYVVRGGSYAGRSSTSIGRSFSSGSSGISSGSASAGSVTRGGFGSTSSMHASSGFGGGGG